MDKALYYSDVYLVPKYSTLRSRSEADVSVKFLGHYFKSPVIPANMASVIDEKLAHWMSQNGYFYIMHRFGDNYQFVLNANKNAWDLVSVSIGVKEADKDFIRRIISENLAIDFITIDIAQGHSILMEKMIKWIKSEFSLSSSYSYDCPKIIAGNVTTREAFYDLVNWGADAIKGGISGGRACSSKNTTSFHVPNYTLAQWMGDILAYSEVPIILDGGIREDGDIAKAIQAGSKNGRTIMVMAGSVFAACVDSPGMPIYDLEYSATSPKYKQYYGSASKMNKEKTGQEIKHIEGFETQIECNGLTFAQKFEQIEQNLQSAISYAGGIQLSDLGKVEAITIK